MSQPVITVNNKSVGAGQAVAASSFIASVSDPNNYTISYYDFRDDGSGGGYFVLNGVAQAYGAWITVSAADLGSLYYIGGASVGSESVDVAAWDGYAWSNYQTATATTTASTLPVIIVKGQTVDVGSTIAASSFIVSASDPTNKAITFYDFRDEGGDGGYFSLNGVAQADGTWITIAAADLPKLTYVGASSSGSETVDVAAWNGSVWSYYATASATTRIVSPPVITVQAISVAENASVAASSFITSVSDPNNYAIAFYDFRDDGAGGGHFALNGVTQAYGTWITVAAADLSKLAYVGGSSGGTESIDVAASNGHVWSYYQTATAITQAAQYATRPTITVKNQTVSENGSIQASTLIASVSDPNNNPITYYDFRDDGAGGGSFVLSGIPQTAGTWITVSASDLANLIYVGGGTPGSEAVDVAAWDGQAWSFYQTASVTTKAPDVALPVITVANQSVGVNASIQASSFIASVTDPNNKTITAYDFRDDGSGGGHFVLNGQVQTAGTWINVTTANLSTLTYVGGASAGSEQVDVAAWDGQAWSNLKTATATTVASASTPTVTAQNISVATNASTAASAIVAQVADPGGYSITTYKFRDDGNDGGHLSLNGTAQANNTWVTVAAANLASLTYVGAPSAGTETLEVEVYDGHTWSNPASATATTTGSGQNPVIAQLHDPGIKADVTAGLSNNSLSYTAMLKILQDAATGGATATKFADLQTLVASFNKANGIQVSAYLAYITKALVDGDAANAHWTGGAATSVALGNLSATSSQTQMNELIQKWFLGGDLPSLLFDSAVNATYKADTSPLYNNTGLPAVSDINQGDIGDCYLLASLAEIAQDEPNVLKSLITDNGNNTYGVEFFINGQGVYVTVNNQLPYYTGTNNHVVNTSPDLWSCLVEKAYVQLNEEPGFLDHTAGNAYKLIDNGLADPITQITGRTVTTYNSTQMTAANWSALKATIVTAIQGGREVDFGSFGETTISGSTAFVKAHMFSGLGYDTATGDFIVRNPWGAENGQTWLTQFEATMADLQAVNGVLFVASGSTGATPTQLFTLGLEKAYDSNADGYSDVLFRNASGVTYLDELNGATVTAGATTSVQVGVVWQIKGVADFNNDGTADILWSYYNSANAADPLNGVSYVSLQSGPTAVAGGGVVQQLSSAWLLVGVGDFNGDGMADVLYRNTSTGQAYLDIMNGSSVNWAASGFTSQQVTDAKWQVAGVADFNGDGNTDVLWRYNNAANASDALNGTLYEWQMNGKSVPSAGLLSQQAGKNWQVAGTGDFNGDGNADILFRYENAANASDALNGFTYIDFMNGANVTSGSPTQWQVNNSWAIASIGDYNGDGMSDILLQQVSTGNTYIWSMNGANVTSGAFTSQQAGAGWTVQNGVLIG